MERTNEQLLNMVIDLQDETIKSLQVSVNNEAGEPKELFVSLKKQLAEKTELLELVKKDNIDHRVNIDRLETVQEKNMIEKEKLKNKIKELEIKLEKGFAWSQMGETQHAIKMKGVVPKNPIRGVKQ